MRLTVVIPLKGREDLTDRCLRHAKELPYLFLLADGQARGRTYRFPNVEYIAYPDDVDFSRFWAKMADAYMRVRTRYVMTIDNDDFVGLSGTERALDFLDHNPDYVCARGRTVDFPRFSTNHLYKNITGETPEERIREGGLYHAVYSAVFRTEAAAQIWREIAEINFSDFMLHENYVALRTLSLGKVRMDQTTVSKYAQIGGMSSQKQDWVSHLLRSRFSEDAQAMMTRLPAKDDVLRMLARYYDSYASAMYGPRGQLKSMMPWLVKAWRKRPRLSGRKELYSRLKKAGANPQEIQRVREDLAGVERVLQ